MLKKMIKKLKIKKLKKQKKRRCQEINMPNDCIVDARRIRRASTEELSDTSYSLTSLKRLNNFIT